MNEKVILFGASNLGGLAYELLNKNYDICYYCDNDNIKIGNKINDIQIIGIDDLKEIYEDYKIIITSAYTEEISNQLEKLDITEYMIFSTISYKNMYMLKQRKNLENNVYAINYNREWIKFYLPNINEYVQRQIYSTRMFYEINILERLKDLKFDNKAIIDIGANIGNHSLFFAKVINSSKVFSFEPNKEVVEILRKNMIVNNVENKVNISNIGLGNKNGKGCMEIIDHDNLGASKVLLSEEGEFEVKTLDEIFENLKEDIGLIKIDVEGMDLQVLEGGRNLINKFRPTICIEAHDKEEYNNIFKFLNEYNYKNIYYDNVVTYIFST